MYHLLSLWNTSIKPQERRAGPPHFLTQTGSLRVLASPWFRVSSPLVASVTMNVNPISYSAMSPLTPCSRAFIHSPMLMRTGAFGTSAKTHASPTTTPASASFESLSTDD